MQSSWLPHFSSFETKTLRVFVAFQQHSDGADTLIQVVKPPSAPIKWCGDKLNCAHGVGGVGPLS